ncbi:type I-E CRISPR-associated protein Cse1/CasA [Kitasatospora sp. NPDC088160]|uniref:type I-E CRISPR-associated protein Cse1/CasA n=1 Tax=Kitasatospora sp. NPDC088160 TaxID=3364072 RepID=UPI003817BF9C
MPSSFNLSESGWVPVHDLDTDTYREVGLREALARAHRLRLELVPGQELAVLLRVLLAAFDAAAGPGDTAEWQHAWRAETLDAARICAYFDRWAPRFNLYDPHYPAFQSGHLTECARGPEVLHPSYLMSQTGRQWFARDETGPGGSAVPAPAAALRLLVLLGYDVSSLKAAPGGGLTYGAPVPPVAGSAHVSVHGHLLLKDQLLLNLPPQPRAEGDLPVWERDPAPPAIGKERQAAGRLDLWTWPARAMRLRADDDGATVAVAWHDGERLQSRWESQQALDPLTAWRTPKVRGTIAPAHIVDQSGLVPPWMGVLLMSSRGGPLVLRHLRAAIERGDVPDDTQLSLAVSAVTHGTKHQTTITGIPAASAPIGRAGLWRGTDPRRRDLLAWAAAMPAMAERAMHRAAAEQELTGFTRGNQVADPGGTAWSRLLETVAVAHDPEDLRTSWHRHLLTYVVRPCMEALPRTSRGHEVKAQVAAETHLRRLAGGPIPTQYATGFASVAPDCSTTGGRQA